jgi:O-6-methylguanine DNA methyltransferase
MTGFDRDLRALATTAPAGLDRRVLRTVGLADSYVQHAFAGGDLLVAWNPRGVSAVWILDDAHPEEAFLRDFESRFARPIDAAPGLPARLGNLLDRSLATGRLGRLPLDLRASPPFHRAALEQAARIPPGEVRSYAWVAREAGRPAAVRAAGSAMATNPVPVLVPCHRVVRTDGTLGNYGFGLPVKRRLLTLEGLDLDAIEALASRGVRVVADTRTGVYCLPACGRIRRAPAGRRRELRSAAEAEAAGYSACPACRP